MLARADAPQKFFDLYPEEDITLPPNPTPPTDVPPVALQRKIYGWCEKPDLEALCGRDAGAVALPETFPLDGSHLNATAAKYLRRAYYASYVDALYNGLVEHRSLLRTHLASVFSACQLKHARAPERRTSFTDSNLGQILDAFDVAQLAPSSVFVLWSDHGWQLGDNDLWAKVSFDGRDRTMFLVTWRSCSNDLSRAVPCR